MTGPLRIRRLQIHPLRIPLRLRFEHAAASRDTSDPVIVHLEAGAPFAHHVGHGETHGRTYVTGETVQSIVDDILKIFAPRLSEFRPQSFAEALEFIEDLPIDDGGRLITAARSAVELALIDLAGRVFHRRPADVAGWMGLPGFGPPGSLPEARYTGVVVGSTRSKLQRFLRLQRWFGLRNFKLKVGIDGWEQRLQWAHEVLGPAIKRGRVSLRVDANGAWSLAEAHEAVPTLEKYDVSVIEQPLSDVFDDDLPFLAEQTNCRIMVDESLLTLDDAERLIKAGGVRVFNIRLAKNGGLLPSLRIARLAQSSGVDVQLGCLVGETSLLAGAAIGFLETCPKVRSAEGAFGSWLLRDDITRRGVRFGFGGRVRRRRGCGLGVDVNHTALRRLASEKPHSIVF